MKVNATSFLSEHSAEFSVFRRLEVVLQGEYAIVVPLYFWLSREGGCLAEAIHGSDRFWSVALFPRRPKLRWLDDDRILMTVNDTVIRTADLLSRQGIPSIAGCPLGRSFWELSGGAPCLFVGLGCETPPQYCIRTGIDKVEPDEGVLSDDSAILRFIRDRASALTLGRLTEAVRSTRDPFRATSPGAFSTGHKPLLVLLRKLDAGSPRL